MSIENQLVYAQTITALGSSLDAAGRERAIAKLDALAENAESSIDAEFYRMTTQALRQYGERAEAEPSSSSAPIKPQIPFLYGALYMDKGERMRKAQEQIDSLRDMMRDEGRTPVVFGFDIQFKRKHERKVASELAIEVENAIHEAFAGSGITAIVTATQYDGKNDVRPAREWITTFLENGEEAADAKLREFAPEGSVHATDRGFVIDPEPESGSES